MTTELWIIEWKGGGGWVLDTNHYLGEQNAKHLCLDFAKRYGKEYRAVRFVRAEHQEWEMEESHANNGSKQER